MDAAYRLSAAKGDCMTLDELRALVEQHIAHSTWYQSTEDEARKVEALNAYDRKARRCSTACQWRSLRTLRTW